MQTKADRRQVIRQLARLISQSRFAAGDAESRGWTAEAAAWGELSRWLACHAAFYATNPGLLWPDQLPLDLP